MLQIDTNLRVGILCLYAYNDSPVRMHIWRIIHETQLSQAFWILCGEFNQVDDLADCIGGEIHTRMNSQETSEWQRMLFSLDLVDIFSLPNFLHLTDKKLEQRTTRRL